jgi:acyl phosphate:glycerol-3-phosphate acyltransferase
MRFVALLVISASFWIGAIPFGVLIARRRGVEIREHGSGNIGATNVARVLGPVAGAIVLVLDASKGALAVATADWLFGIPWFVALCGFVAILGHCFSPFLDWHGGKGVATAFGVFLVVAPAITAVAVLVFIVIWRITRVPALGSLAASMAISAALLAGGERAYSILACVTTVLLVYTHRTNLAKLGPTTSR